MPCKLLVLVLATSLFVIPLDAIHAEAEKSWYLGKGLIVGDSFTYKICDPLLLIKVKVKDMCYTAKLDFKQITKNSNVKNWIAQAEIEHGSRIINSTMQISALTFQARTDYTMKPYAMSIQRTLFYLNNYANILAQKPLEVGAVWGDAVAYGAHGAKIVVKQLKAMEVADLELQTYKLGYEVMKESTLYLADDFPFPIKAKMYEPTLAYPDPPLKFEVELIAVAFNA